MGRGSGERAGPLLWEARQDLFTTDLTAAEIILGKLLDQMAQLGELALVGLPLLFFLGIFGVLPPTLLLAVALGPVRLLAAVGAASVSWRKITSGKPRNTSSARDV